MTEPRPPARPDETPDDVLSVSLAERLADDQARRAARRARLPAFFFGVMFAAAVGGLVWRDAGFWGPGGAEGAETSGLDVADAALALFAALAFALGTFGEERVKLWLGRWLGQRR